MKRIKQSAALCLLGYVGLGYVGLVCLVGLSTNAMAEEPARAESQPQSASDDKPEDHRQLGYLLIGTSCALGLGMAGVLMFIRRRRRDMALLDFEGFRSIGESDFSPTPHTIEASGRRADSSSKPASISAEAVLESMDAPSAGFAPNQSREPRRECPRCSRTYPATIVVCPYDAATLRPARQETGGGRSKKRGQHGLERMACTGCERRYEANVDFCYHDGLPLMQDTRERAYGAPSFKACERCGWEGEADDQTLCPNDACSDESSSDRASKLIEIDPSDSTHVRPTIPMTICPTCREYGTPGTAFCPNDGDVFTPLLNMRVTKFRTGGFGPRRKMCTECGAEHGGHAFYCGNDGARLVALN
jgi:ferredoxin